MMSAARKGLAQDRVARSLAIASLGALGVVYGDIGTSPLYAFKTAVQASGGPPAAAAIGVASLIIWSLLLIVSLKYALLILRADNNGEGGVVAMLALLDARHAPPRTLRHALLIMGLVGAALLYGDGAITPAISVLSAVEGLKLDAPGLSGVIVPVASVILLILFWVQSRGTGFIGKLFGPVMLCWFIAIGALGVSALLTAPQALIALSPNVALAFLLHAPLAVSFAVLSAVFLAVTGGEAMYADMGHFGRLPIRAAWFGIALPALVLNYLGQAALLTHHPGAVANPFYALAPRWLHYPLVAFATAATVIASQAIISGVFSLTQQSMQLGFLPRLTIQHTEAEQRGQVYLPLANWLLAGATLAAVFAFRSSDALAGAYGIAVSGLMAISTFLASLVALKWRYNPVLVVLVNGAFLLIDCVFFSANAMKFFDGGWFPLALAASVAVLMLTWRRGVELVERARAHLREDESAFIQRLTHADIARTPGIGAFLSASTSGVPLSLSRHLRHNGALQSRILLVSVVTSDVPFVPRSDRASISRIAPDVDRIVLKFGFMDDPDIPDALQASPLKLSASEWQELTYYIGRETVIADRRIPGMANWRERLFVAMQRNTTPSAGSFCIPSSQSIEIGTEIRI